MKVFLLAISLLFYSNFVLSQEDCEMFGAELSIVQDQMKSIVEDVTACHELAEVASDERNKTSDEKMLRLIKSSNKQADLMSHSITQISLRPECACEGFDFELVNQKIIEVKYLIKRVKSVDIEKQKPDQYASFLSNTEKLSEVLKGFAAYVYDPCKTPKPAPPEPMEELVAEESTEELVEEEAIQDTTVASEPAPIVEKIDTTKQEQQAKVEEPYTEPAFDALAKVDSMPKNTIQKMDTQKVVTTAVAEAAEQVEPVKDTIVNSAIAVSTDTIVEEQPIETIVEEPEPPVNELPKADTLLPTADSIIETESEPESEPVAEAVEQEEEEIEPEPTPQTVTPTTPEPILPTPPATPVQATQKPKTEPQPIKTAVNNKETKEVYFAVQVAAGADAAPPTSLSGLNEDFYIIEEGGLNKFRVGHYGSISEAVESKNNIFKKGIRDAFVVAYANGKKVSPSEARNLQSDSNETTKEQETVQTTPSPSKRKTPKIKKRAQVYLAVQIGASVSAADPIYELAKYEHQLQLKVKSIKGSPVRYYTGESTNQMEAEQTLSLVKSKGIDKAFMIGIADGERVNYTDALEFLKSQ